MPSPDPSPALNPVRAGLKATALWIGIELGMVVLAGILAIALSLSLDSGTAFILERVAHSTAMVLLGMMFRRKVQREGLDWRAMGYAPLRKPVVAGAVAGIVLLLTLATVTAPLDTMLFPAGVEIEAQLLQRIKEGGPVAAALLLPGNGLLTPIVEEYAWRGYVQTRLTQGWGVRAGMTLTALLFAAKHSIIDVSLFRLTTVLVGSFALGLLRVRWGTTVTTIAHAGVNFAATSLLIVSAYAR